MFHVWRSGEVAGLSGRIHGREATKEFRRGLTRKHGWGVLVTWSVSTELDSSKLQETVFFRSDPTLILNLRLVRY